MRTSQLILKAFRLGGIAWCLAGCAAHRFESVEPAEDTLADQGPRRGTAPAVDSTPVATHQRVSPGDTLYRISKKTGVAISDLRRANQLKEGAVLSVGQVLIIPRDKLVPPAEVRKLQWPLRGVLYARFGKKGDEPHDGIDLAAPAGTSVKTALAGTVLYAGDQRGYGLIVIVDHGSGWITLYAHAHDLRVKADQKVREGQVIATVGESGDASGPHLHFEFRVNGVPVDPLRYLNGFDAPSTR